MVNSGLQMSNILNLQSTSFFFIFSIVKLENILYFYGLKISKILNNMLSESTMSPKMSCTWLERFKRREKKPQIMTCFLIKPAKNYEDRVPLM